MENGTVEEVLERLVLDADFRKQMEIDRVQALADYDDLTDEERATLMALDLDTLDSGLLQFHDGL